MALFTGKGDNGTTKFFGCDQKRVSKSSSVAEALGNLDEVNSFIGIIKVEPESKSLIVKTNSLAEIMESIQQNIFTVSAGLAGSDKKLGEEKTKELEEVILECERELPPITTFSLAGGTLLSAKLDFARTLARRAERRVVAVNDELSNVDAETLKYLNRLSSILFALARLVNHRSGIKESAPSYN